MTEKDAVARLEALAVNAAGAMGSNPNVVPDYEALNMAIAALRAQRERSEPLTPDDLRQMDGEPVYSADRKKWFLVEYFRAANKSLLIDSKGCPHNPNYCMPLYRHKPEPPENYQEE